MKEWTIASDILWTPVNKSNTSATAVGFHLDNALKKKKNHPATSKLIFPNALPYFIA